MYCFRVAGVVAGVAVGVVGDVVGSVFGVEGTAVSSGMFVLHQ